MKSNWFDEYLLERQKLQPKEIDQLLEAGQLMASAHNCSQVLTDGGALFFPHTFLSVCGTQIAAAVMASLFAGADCVLAIGVLHSLSPELVAARRLERAHNDISDLPFWGMHGPGISRGGNLWRSEYSLLSFEFLWHHAIERFAIKKPPQLILRYPYLANRHPESLPGIDELEAMAKDACIVASVDFCHHGIAYGQPKEIVLPIGPKAHALAKKNITEHLKVLQTGSYDDYYNHCIEIISDSCDVGTVVHHLRGPQKPQILDIVLADVSAIYNNNSEPSWVAACLAHQKIS